MLTMIAASLAATLQPVPPAPPTPPGTTTVEKRIVKTIDADGNEVTREVTEAEVEASMQSCGGRRFEAEVESVAADGGTAKNKMVLCSSEPSDASYRAMLEQARDQVEGTEMDIVSRDAILEQIDAELATVSQ